jgi:hypothetical protein
MAKARSGGGLTSNKLVQSKRGKQEPKSHKVSVPAVAQQGAAVQFKKSELQQGPGSGYQTKAVPPSGIPGTYNAATQGPGSQRAVYRSGSQSTYGKVNPGEPRPKPVDILSQFGPEATGKK